jgi:hypothetical protein
VVTITGGDFLGATQVLFGSVPAYAYTVNSATSITAVAPTQAAGVVDVRVTTPGGTSAISSANHFTYLAAAVVNINVTILSAAVATFTISRTGSDLTAPLTVSYTVGGTAVPGVDYTGLSLGTSSVTLAPAQSSVSLPVTLIPVTLIQAAPSAGGKTIIVTLNPDPEYTLGTSISAELVIASS